MGGTKILGAAMASSLMVAGLVAATAAPSAAAGCVIRDGVSSTGTETGRNPTRFEYTDSPYLGARYNSCTDKVVLYYGGYTNTAAGWHYNVRFTTGGQRELSPGSSRKWTFNNPGGTSLSAVVQLCKKGGFAQRSSCTRWSPTVRVSLR
ncbi:hypothetical protein ITP53_37440 [Nonomuraea sp. K274]|uniref:Secreted protein n=1 Tax=Nonomuraea cypriaca TaxID=1187855 RepID=A0A931AJG5_9ACTN|nr:hypothetical protein [Nonomuraea cypriaca]MBF8191290.1 hypothetical protein [Nonomuraea cypriaca]